MINYFVSYRYYSEKQTGHGMVNVSLIDPISSYEIVQDVTKRLAEGLKDEYGEPVKRVIITNWKRYEEDQYPAPPGDVGRRLYEACENEKWKQQYQPSCGESIYQVDKVNLACPELVEELMDIVGYFKHEEDE